jgi:UDPglucose--hexose-1-phosphate uridylyltransferase
VIEPPTDEELERCPFCAGREDRTPPEVLRLGDDPWRVRVVPNLYPAFERQEVVIHSPDHVRSFAELADEQLSLIAEAWLTREEEIYSAGAGFTHAFVNEGRLAGASLPHSHSQLVAFPGSSPAEEAERTEQLTELLEREDLVVARESVAESDDVVALAHPFGASPYECLIVPRTPSSGSLGGGGDFLVAQLRLLRGLVRALRGAVGSRPWNAWFHSDYHAHAHFVPRLTALAGLELGAGVYVNIVPPEQAAEALRATD